MLVTPLYLSFRNQSQLSQTSSPTVLKEEVNFSRCSTDSAVSNLKSCSKGNAVKMQKKYTLGFDNITLLVFISNQHKHVDSHLLICILHEPLGHVGKFLVGKPRNQMRILVKPLMKKLTWPSWHHLPH